MTKFLCAVLAVAGLSSTGAYAAGADEVIGIIGDLIGDRIGRGPGYGGGGHYDDDYGYGGGGYGSSRVTCKAVDRGWEEHFGGHGSCGECLRKHGRCQEECSEEGFTCLVVGVRGGRQREFYGYGGNPRRALNRAYDECEYRGFRRCEERGCNRESRVVSRRNC